MIREFRRLIKIQRTKLRRISEAYTICVLYIRIRTQTLLVPRERTPHDVVLEIADDPSREPLLTAKLQSSLYGPQDPAVFLKAYEAALKTRLDL